MCVSVRVRESSGGGGGGAQVENRVLASLLAEMDGVQGACDQVFVLAATNRLDAIDAALCRKVSEWVGVVMYHIESLD